MHVSGRGEDVAVVLAAGFAVRVWLIHRYPIVFGHDTIVRLAQLESLAFDGAPAPSKHLARSVALVGKQAPATGTGATINRDAGIGCRGGLLGQPLPPQLLHAATDCLEIVSCSGP